jgi:hypothetical protein
MMDDNNEIKHEKMLELRNELQSAEEDRLNGAKYFSVDETAKMMEDAAGKRCNT